MPKGIPSHDTFGRRLTIFAQIKPEEFQKRFIEWVQATEKLTSGQVIAIDGKKLRRSHERNSGKAIIYMVSAWATQNQLVLVQTKVAEKSNEITAIPELLRLLEIIGCIVTVDAIGTQTEIAKEIIDDGGDYLLAVKENQGNLFEDIQYLFAVDAAHGFAHVEHSYAKTITGIAEDTLLWQIEPYINFWRAWRCGLWARWTSITTEYFDFIYFARIYIETYIGFKRTEVSIW